MTNVKACQRFHVKVREMLHTLHISIILLFIGSFYDPDYHAGRLKMSRCSVPAPQPRPPLLQGIESQGLEPETLQGKVAN